MIADVFGAAQISAKVESEAGRAMARLARSEGHSPRGFATDGGMSPEHKDMVAARRERVLEAVLDCPDMPHADLARSVGTTKSRLQGDLAMLRLSGRLPALR